MTHKVQMSSGGQMSRKALMTSVGLMSPEGQISAQRLHHRIMQNRPEIPNFFIVATRMNPIGQKNDDNRTIQIHPEGRACKPQMPDTIPGEITAAGRPFCGWAIKSKRPLGSFSIIQKFSEQARLKNVM